MAPAAPIAPAIAKSLDDLVRSDFESFRNICFNWLLISTAVVAVGLLLELPEIAHESVEAIQAVRNKLKKREIAPWMKLLVTLGWLLIVGGVVGEFVADSFVSRADGIITTFNETLLAGAQRTAGLADERAASAFERAAETESEASQENERAARAEQEAQQENERAATALEAAEIARKEAEGFQLQIAQANERAASAEQRSNEAELELARIRTPRSLTNEAALIAALIPFKGTEYTLTVSQDDESIQFTRVVDEVLAKAEWVRKQPTQHNVGITYFNVFSQEFKDGVPVCVGTGIQVHMQEKESVEILQSTPEQSLPKGLRAAIALRTAFASSVLPVHDRNVGKVVSVEKGQEEGPVVVCVGQKP